MQVGELDVEENSPHSLHTQGVLNPLPCVGNEEHCGCVDVGVVCVCVWGGGGQF